MQQLLDRYLRLLLLICQIYVCLYCGKNKILQWKFTVFKWLYGYGELALVFYICFYISILCTNPYFCFRLGLIELISKQNKTVPVPLTPEIVTTIESLLEFRQRCGLQDTNQYVFASTGDGPVSSWNALQALAIETGCKKAELLTPSRLRKYVAIVVRVCCL